MQATIHDREALKAVSPAALAAYARSAGWQRGETYRVHSHVYAGPDRPEIIVPRTDHLGDYATVVSRLIGVFAQVADLDELTVYRSLVTGDRDVVRIRVADSDDGSLGLNEGVDLVSGARKLIQSAACSLSKTQPVYRAGAIQEAKELLEQVRLGQTDQGSFVITVLTPVVQPLQQELFPGLSDEILRGDEDRDAPIQRKMTRRLVEALKAARESTERFAAGESDAFSRMVEKGVSANLCEALTCLIGPFSTLDIGVSWAQTRPSPLSEAPVQFGRTDSPILQEAARWFRHRAPQEGIRLHGFIQLLKRSETQDDGTIHLTTHVDEQLQAVRAVLSRSDYDRAVQAHKDKAMVTLKGDLERRGQRWWLLNPQVEGVLPLPDEDAAPEDEQS
ncbi:MAG: hypothetical protein OXC96_03830 [Cyanobacteria bacterium MAG CAR1_bin_15]|nr:hypothetical protein [Cyanobacteria bacterium MAG CAR1_bin_15]